MTMARVVHATVAGLLRSLVMVGAHGGGSPVTRSSPTASSRPPLASPGLQLRRPVAKDGVRC
jgi:hypothetical protein